MKQRATAPSSRHRCWDTSCLQSGTASRLCELTACELCPSSEVSCNGEAARMMKSACQTPRGVAGQRFIIRPASFVSSQQRSVRSKAVALLEAPSADESGKLRGVKVAVYSAQQAGCQPTQEQQGNRIHLCPTVLPSMTSVHACRLICLCAVCQGFPAGSTFGNIPGEHLHRGLCLTCQSTGHASNLDTWHLTSKLLCCLSRLLNLAHCYCCHRLSWTA